MPKSLDLSPLLNRKRLTLGRWFIGLVETYKGAGTPLSQVLKSKSYTFEGQPMVIHAVTGTSCFFPCSKVKVLRQFWPSNRRKYRPYSCYEKQIVVITEDETWAEDELFCQTFMPGLASHWKVVAEKYELITRVKSAAPVANDASLVEQAVEREFRQQNGLD